MVERIFETSRGPLRVKLFEGKVGWNIPGRTPYLFAWNISQRKFESLPELEQIEVNEKYFQWLVEEGCGKCKLLGNTCSGLKPIQFNHSVEGQHVEVNSYEASFQQSAVDGKSYGEIKKVIKNGASCKPKEW